MGIIDEEADIVEANEAQMLRESVICGTCGKHRGHGMCCDECLEHNEDMQTERDIDREVEERR